MPLDDAISQTPLFFLSVGMTHEEIRRHKPHKLMSALSGGGFDTDYLKSILSPDYTVEDIVYGVMAMMGGFDPSDYSGDYGYMYSDSTPGEMATTEADQSASNPTTESTKPEKGIFDFFKIEFGNSEKTNETKTTPMPDDELTTESNEITTDNLTSDMSMTNETVRNATTESQKKKTYNSGGILSLFKSVSKNNNRTSTGSKLSMPSGLQDGTYSKMIEGLFG